MLRSMKNEKGFTLIETIIALALLGVVAVAFLGALVTASNAFTITDEHATAESLARSQIEYLKNQPYKEATPYDPGTPGSGEVIYEKITGIPDDYIICSFNRDGYIVNNIVYGIPWDSQNGQPLGVGIHDGGLQKVKLVIKHGDKQEFILEDYKVNR
jgi:prepilin-type N-terminal cleavage/methylation domain-containing protein